MKASDVETAKTHLEILQKLDLALGVSWKWADVCLQLYAYENGANPSGQSKVEFALPDPLWREAAQQYRQDVLRKLRDLGVEIYEGG